VENVLTEKIPFVLEVKLLDLANSFAVGCVFYYFSNHNGYFVGFRNSINAAEQPQDRKTVHSTLIARTLPLSNTLGDKIPKATMKITDFVKPP
jgi:hypothetical protein